MEESSPASGGTLRPFSMEDSSTEGGPLDSFPDTPRVHEDDSKTTGWNAWQTSHTQQAENASRTFTPESLSPPNQLRNVLRTNLVLKTTREPKWFLRTTQEPLGAPVVYFCSLILQIGRFSDHVCAWKTTQRRLAERLGAEALSPPNRLRNVLSRESF
ncbi:hypothetical protein PGT21_034572 [Puccinia graminis f. sp. tritici]|uniref:Uncharacterized protein n=1 Tax=Puccinia graminis f. sp. tritici TaxID=56615 RepID=A0A5B0PM77_PUCGR|nr:hypothetical protein PGT21_034572 [Puccinia graminis f. sp. tritici]